VPTRTSALKPSSAEPSDLFALVAELFPMSRSITGDGVRQTLACLGRRIPLDVHEVTSGTRVFDWTVPDEWNVREAWIADPSGRRVVDVRRSNLHLVQYSVPIRARLSLDALRPHLFSLPDHPDRVPYRTSYYTRTWGFCLTHRELQALPDGEYEVCVDTTLEPGSLTYGECWLPGDSDDEVLVSAHICHPSLANDNLSGVAVATGLAEILAARPSRRYSYRFVFAPGTIGAITWLARHESGVDRIRHGLVLAGVGDPGGFTYKRSRRGNAEIDRAAAHVLCHGNWPHTIEDFSPYGYDERQYCSPGFDLPVGCLMRTPHGLYSEHHTSADDLRFVTPQRLDESLRVARAIMETLEANRRYVSQNPKCEPQLGRRGLYRPTGGVDSEGDEMALLWLLNLADGGHSLLDVAERSGLAFATLERAARALGEAGLLKAAV
jgi:aminopeptidase-like protein